MKVTYGSRCRCTFSSALATALGSMTTSSCSSLCAPPHQIAFQRLTLVHTPSPLTAWNPEPSIATGSAFTKLTERASRTNSVPGGYALAYYAPLASVLRSGASRPQQPHQLNVPPVHRPQLASEKRICRAKRASQSQQIRRGSQPAARSWPPPCPQEPTPPYPATTNASMTWAHMISPESTLPR